MGAALVSGAIYRYQNIGNKLTSAWSKNAIARLTPTLQGHFFNLQTGYSILAGHHGKVSCLRYINHRGQAIAILIKLKRLRPDPPSAAAVERRHLHTFGIALDRHQQYFAIVANRQTANNRLSF